MPSNRKLRVFLCHTNQDKPLVRELYTQLNAKGWIEPWLDEEKLLPGQDWGLEIEKTVESADIIIVCLSKNSINKEGYIQKEIKKALDLSEEKPDGSIFIIPLLLDNCDVPKKLRRWHWLNYYEHDKKALSNERLLGSLTARAKALGISFLDLPISSSDFQEYFELRTHIEASFWYEAVILLTDDDKKELENLLESALIKLESTPFQNPHEEHRKLHLLIFSRIQNSLIKYLLEGYWNSYEQAGLDQYNGSIDYLKEVWSFHTKIVKSIIKNDVDEGYRSLMIHTDLLYHRTTS